MGENRVKRVIRCRCSSCWEIFRDSKDQFTSAMDEIMDIYLSEAKPFVFSNLSENQQKIICERKCVRFQGQAVTLKELLTPTKYVDFDEIIDSDLLGILSREKVVKIGRNIGGINRNNGYEYVQRKCIRDKECLSEEQLCDIESQTANRIFNINGLSGSGKTFLLDSLTAVAKRMNPYAWIIKIDLNDYRNSLMEFKRQKTRVTVQDLLNSKPDTKLNALETKIFSITRKVILMIDGIDELPSEYKDLILDILKDCETKRNFARVFVTTSPKLDDTPIKSKLSMKYQLVSFSAENQVNILKKYWEKKFSVSGNRKERCKVYAESLVAQNWITDDENMLVGVPLQIRMLVEVMANTGNFLEAGSEAESQGCDAFIFSDNDNPTLPSKFSLGELYQLFIRRNCLSAVSSTVSDTVRRDVWKINEECNNYLYVIALQSMLSLEQCEHFNSYRNRQDIPKEKLERLGIIKEKNKRYQFTHASLAEYFLAECIAMEYINNDRIEFMRFLFDEIFMQKRFALVRMFLNNFVKTDWNTISATKVEHIRFVLGHGENFKMLFFRIAAEEGNLELLRFPVRDCDSFKLISGMSYHDYLQHIIGETIPHIAMDRSHFNMAKYLLRHGADIQFRDGMNRTLLHIAAKRNNLDAVRFLVKKGAEVDCKDSKGRTPLHEAAQFGSIEMLQYLLSEGAEVNRRDKAGHTALHDAVKGNSLQKVQCLLEKDADVNSTCHCGNYYCLNPVFAAVREGNLDIVKCLVEKGANVGGRSQIGHFILHYFVEGNHDDNKITPGLFPDRIEILKFLLDHGASMYSVDQEGNTIQLSLINEQDDVELVKYLVENEQFDDLPNHRGYNPFTKAVEVGAVNIVKYLMEQNLFYIPCPPSPPTGVLANAIVKAAGGGHLDVLKHLAEKGVSLNVEDKVGNSPLHQAVSNNRVEVIKFLVEEGASLHGVNHNYETISTTAAKNCDDDVIVFLVNSGLDTDGMLEILIEAGRLNIVRYLVEKGATVDSVNDVGGNFELLQYLHEKNFKIAAFELRHLAAGQGNLDILKYLVEKGMHLALPHRSSPTTLLHAAVLSDQPHVVEYLLKEGFLVDIKDRLNNTPLMRAVDENGLTDSIRILIEHRADVNAVDDESGNTVLCQAASRKRFDLVKILTEHGADVNARNRAGDTPLHCALRNDALEVAEYLEERSSNRMIVDVVKEILVTIGDQPGNQSLIDRIFSKLETVEYLIEKGFEVSDNLSNRYELLVKASEAGSYNLVNRLLEMGSRVNQTNKKGYTAAHMATVYNMQKLLLKKGANVNAKTRKKVSVLHHIANFGTFESFKLVVENGGDVNSLDNKGYSALHYAARQGSYDKVKYLLGYGARPTTASDGTTVLYHAIGGDIDVVKLMYNRNAFKSDRFRIMHKALDQTDLDTLKFLLETGGAVNAADKNRTTLLHRAVAEGRYNSVMALLSAHATAHTTNKDGSTPLHDATLSGDIEMVKALLTYGATASINSQDADGNTPVHFAVKSGDLSMVERLVESVANLEIKNSKGRTAFHETAYGGHSDIVRYLLNKGLVDINQRDSDGNTLLHEAVEKSDLKLAKFLLEMGANVNVPTLLNRTPLSTAAALGCLPMVELLLEGNADVHIAAIEHRTPLHEAARHGYFRESESHLKVMDALVAKGADVNSKTIWGRTPLHEAAVQCDIHKIQFLVDKGSQLDIETNRGETPLMEALKSEEKRSQGGWDSELNLVRYFIEEGARYDVTVNGRNLMHEAAASGDKDVVVYLLELGVDINSVTPDGSTMLHEAAKSGSINLASFLLNKGLKLDARSSNGSTPLHEATRRMRHDLMQYLAGLMVDVNLADERGKTALHLSTEINDTNGCKILVRAGADPYIKDSGGRMPSECTDPELVKWLRIRGGR